MHNLFCDNCHSHVATALDLMHYNGSNRLVQFPAKAQIVFFFIFLNRFSDPELIGSLDPDSDYGSDSRLAKMYPNKEKRKDRVVQDRNMTFYNFNCFFVYFLAGKSVLTTPYIAPIFIFIFFYFSLLSCLSLTSGLGF
jgi:hypothetical protein